MLYLFFGHDLVSSMYEGTSVGLLNSIIEQHELVPVVHYHRKADALAIMGALCYVLILAMGAGYWLGLRRSLVRRVFNVAALSTLISRPSWQGKTASLSRLIPLTTSGAMHSSRRV